MANFSKGYISKKTIGELKPKADRKVTIIGSGKTGMACANAILNRGGITELCLVDPMSPKLIAELLDMQHASQFLNNVKIIGGKEYELSRGSHIIIIASGIRPKAGESRTDLLDHNAKMMKAVISNVIDCNDHPIIIIVTQPCDILTHLAWVESKLPVNRVFGLGNTVDAARLSYFIAERVGATPSECCAWILGENGDNSVPVWSCVNVAGIRLRDLYPDMGKSNDQNNWSSLHKKSIKMNNQVISLKGHVNWSAGNACASIVNDIFNDTGKIRLVSTSAQGQYGITKDIFMSLPCIVSSEGITSVIKLPLDGDELDKLHVSAHNLEYYL